ncbi:MAG: hypothetical protein HY043_04510, partial [Verrucomicrobia bacterium]|nr:hypothetical protein [Verrucomicrobiota bacterium]
HAWLKNQQQCDYQLNLQNCKYHFIWRMTGTVVGGAVALGIFGGGVWLVKNGASAVGTATMIIAVGGLIGTAIYGHRIASQTQKKEDDNRTPISN